MSRPMRLGAVSYLNVRPLVHGLAGPSAPAGVSLEFDVPSECARRLAQGEIDLGMVPSITYLDRRGDRIVPGVCIGSEGPVASVALFTRRPIEEVRSIALDTSSRTSAILTRILCARLFHIAPSFMPHAPELDAMLAVADAALLIGDPALFVDASAHHALKIDLGGAWTMMTGLPFVWAFWSGPAGAVDASGVRLLHAAAEAGQRHTDAIAEEYCVGDHLRQGLARTYFREHMRYALDARAIAGLETYYREAAALGLATARPLEWFAA